MTNTIAVAPTTATELEEILVAAQQAAAPWAALRPSERAAVLDTVADALDAAAETLIPIAMAETNLPQARLTGELKRTTFNIQPFVADKNTAQQGYLTSEPFAIAKAGVKTTTLMFSDQGYPAYATTVSCMDKTLKARSAAVTAFVKASMEGWKSYLADPAPGNALIKKDNPNMTDEQLAYSVAKLKELGMVTGGDAASMGIGVLTDARAKASYDFLVETKLIDPAKVKLADTYTTSFVKDLKVLP